MANHYLRIPMYAALLVTGIIFTPHRAAAQTIDNIYLDVLPGGTNLIEDSGQYQHYNGFQYDNGGPKISGTSLDRYTDTLRYAHYFNVAGYTASVQIFQTVGLYSDWHINGMNLNSQPGVGGLQFGSTTLSAQFWPYVDRARGLEIYTAAYLTPPDPGYSDTRNVNIGSGRWDGDVQVGVHQAVGQNITVDGAFDAAIHGNESIANSQQLRIDPSYRIQLLATWHFSPALSTSFGYSGVFGGENTISGPFGSYQDGRSDAVQAVRGEVAYWWTQALRTSLELDHDIWAGGGYNLGIGVLGRVRFLF